jgi:hypothetical protein
MVQMFKQRLILEQENLALKQLDQMKDETLTQLSDKLEEVMEEENNHLQYIGNWRLVLWELPY